MSAAEDVQPQDFRETVGLFASGVTVVTTATDDGEVHGMTANAFCSLSLDPLLVLVCVDNGSGMRRLAPMAQRFAITVLADGQQEVGRWFATRDRPRGHEQFDAHDWVRAPATGSPVLRGALAYLECTLADSHAGGDHTILVGEVVGIGRLGGTAPLLWFDGRYRHLVP
jgi:flavin reductase (DIM6/NTAB) family NADH-FMN oxidoreductase RutF